MGQTRVYLECLCFYRKIDYDRALRLFICLLIYSQLDRAMSKHRNRENDKKLLHESTRSRGTRCSWQAGRSRPSLPPSLTPHLLGLPCYLNSSNVTRNGASKKREGQGRDAQNTHRAVLVSHSVFAAFSSIFCKKKKKKKKPSERNLGRFCETVLNEFVKMKAFFGLYDSVCEKTTLIQTVLWKTLISQKALWINTH